MSGYKTILVTTDLSDPSLTAVKHAADVAEHFGAQLLAVYVVEDRLPPLILSHKGEMDELMQRHRESAEKTLDEQVKQHLPGKQVETLIREGVVHDEVVKLARERNVDLLVIGMHGHGYLVHALTGSTSERVLHHAPCPVLVVPHK